MKRFFLFLVCLSFVSSAVGCSKKQQPKVNVPEVSEKEDEKEVVEEEERIPAGMALSPITGEYITEEAVARRPFAIMINNNHKALPQSGIGQASMYYETLAEGEITRIVAIFEDFDAEKIGPIRSARDYFTCFALDNDAYFVHHGGSETGYGAIKKRNIDNIDGMNDKAFWRDKNRMNSAGMYEHSSYSDAEGLIESVSRHKYREERDISPMFNFYEEETALGGEAVSANNVTLPYSYYQTSEFVYDSEKRIYERIQSGKPQIDDLTGETVVVKNIIIQQTNISIIPGDDAGRRNVELVGKGAGMFITNGKARSITWEKKDYKTPTQWFDEKGSKLNLNYGKTWVCVFPNNLNFSME